MTTTHTSNLDLVKTSTSPKEIDPSKVLVDLPDLVKGDQDLLGELCEIHDRLMNADHHELWRLKIEALVNCLIGLQEMGMHTINYFLERKAPGLSIDARTGETLFIPELSLRAAWDSWMTERSLEKDSYPPIELAVGLENMSKWMKAINSGFRNEVGLPKEISNVIASVHGFINQHFNKNLVKPAAGRRSADQEVGSLAYLLNALVQWDQNEADLISKGEETLESLRRSKVVIFEPKQAKKIERKLNRMDKAVENRDSLIIDMLQQQLVVADALVNNVKQKAEHITNVQIDLTNLRQYFERSTKEQQQQAITTAISLLAVQERLREKEKAKAVQLSPFASELAELTKGLSIDDQGLIASADLAFEQSVIVQKLLDLLSRYPDHNQDELNPVARALMPEVRELEQVRQAEALAREQKDREEQDFVRLVFEGMNLPEDTATRNTMLATLHESYKNSNDIELRMKAIKELADALSLNAALLGDRVELYFLKTKDFDHYHQELLALRDECFKRGRFSTRSFTEAVQTIENILPANLVATKESLLK